MEGQYMSSQQVSSTLTKMAVYQAELVTLGRTCDRNSGEGGGVPNNIYDHTLSLSVTFILLNKQKMFEG
uniref:Uncharacterized protein n=1 Tax=Arion vulgaris TaxID=1028688 RepID=A0A0B7A793_9EUPU